jgi:outer membrane usher protein
MPHVLMLLLLAAAQVAAGRPQQSFWALTVNDQPQGDVLAALDGDETWLPVGALEQAGLRRIGGDRRMLFNVEHVRLESLAPDVTYRRDLAEVVLRLIAAPRFFDTNVVVLQRDRPDGISYAATTTFFTNYSATWDQEAGNSGYGEAGLAMFGNTTLASAFSVETSGTVVRGLSSMTMDRTAQRIRLEVGDTVTRATPLGSAPIVGGLSIGRDYSLDPYYYRYPAPFIRGTATAPSQVEVIVNGALVRRFEVGPGPYRFDRLPVTAGLGDVKVMVRDPFGGQQIYDMSIYQPTGLLSPGEQDFQYAAGRLRDDNGEQPVYREWQGVAQHRAGLTEWLTVGFSAEGSEDVVAGGPTVSARLAKLGEIELNGWVSQTHDKTQGFAGYGVYTFVSRWLSLSATGQYYGKRFANLFVSPGGFTTPEYYQASAGVPLFSLGSLSYIWEQRRSPAGSFGFVTSDGRFDSEIVRSRAHSARLNLQLPGALQLTASATSTHVRGTQAWTGFAGLNLALGRSATTVSYTEARTREGDGRFLDVNKSLPIGPGIGYRLSGTESDDSEAVSGQFEVNTRLNRLRVNYETTDRATEPSAAATISGGISVTRAGLFLTRPIDESAAVVEVEGLKDVRILIDNTPAGRTNRRGKLVINQMLPYLANRISYVDDDIPFDYRVPVTSQLVAPPYRGMAFIKFPTARIQARVGSVTMLIEGARVVPSYGTIAVTLDGAAVESPLNEAGEFFLDLPNGRHVAMVAFRGETCEVSFEAVASTGLVQKVGTLTCEP